MCVTYLYTDRYPDGHTVAFRRPSTCPYGAPGRPCPTHTTVEEPVRNINFDELTAQHMFTRPIFPQPQPRPQYPLTPPRSPANSHKRHSSSESSHRRNPSRRLLSPLRPTRQHRKERILIVDSPPTPRTPPQQYHQTFTAPSSPASPTSPLYRPYEPERGRPIIVDERRFRRNPSVGAVVADRHTPRTSRDQSRTRHVMWDTPSGSHTSFNSRLRLEQEEIARAQAREASRQAERRERRIREELEARLMEKEREESRRRRQLAFERRQNEDIMSRPAVPFAPTPPLRRTNTQVDRPTVTVVDQRDALPLMMGGLALDDRATRRQEEEEAQKRRLRERQLPKRRFSVGPGFRRSRVAYDDGLYRYD